MKSKFLRGVSFAFAPNQHWDLLKGLNIDSIRFRVYWNNLISELGNTPNYQLTDSIVQNCKTYNIRPMFEIGVGTHLPTNDGQSIDPNVIGKEQYLSLLSAMVEGFVNRYHQDCDIFAIEAELNAAFLWGLYGWRYTSLGGAWKDFDFLTEIIYTLSQIVRNYGNQVTTLVHTGIHDDFNRSLKLPTWTEAIQQWDDALDIVGLSAYPFYFNADKLSIEDVIVRAKGATTKPIFILESAYTIANNPSENIAYYQHTEEKQIQYANHMFDMCLKYHLDGLFYFNPWTTDGFKFGQLTDKDLKALEYLRKLDEDGNIQHLYDAIKELSLTYLRNDFSKVAETVESGFGILYPDATPREAYHSISQRFLGMENRQKVVIPIKKGNNMVAFPYKDGNESTFITDHDAVDVLVHQNSNLEFKVIISYAGHVRCWL